MTIKRFEELDVWKLAIELAAEIYTVTSAGEFSRDFGLRDQARRAVASVAANIAEGFERDGNKEFRQFLSVAKGSAGELISHLYIARDATYLDAPEFRSMYGKALKVTRMLGSLMSFLNSTHLTGRKTQRSSELGTRNSEP